MYSEMSHVEALQVALTQTESIDMSLLRKDSTGDIDVSLAATCLFGLRPFRRAHMSGD